MLKLKRAVCWLLASSILLGTVPAGRAEILSARELAGKSYASRANDTGVDDDPAGDEKKGLEFRLSEGAEQAEGAREANPVAPATRLSESETAKVLQRLPPLKTEATDEQDFALRERSLPPPRTGKTVNASFPAPATADAPATTGAGALEVIRVSPSGEVPLAPQFSVTFSQPMVAVTSQEEASRTVPVELSPQPKGGWRWLGTRTLIFESDERLPMATRYTATVRAGTKSANGNALAATKTWTFSTPPPQLKTSYPSTSPVRRDALMFLSFDQRIDPQAMLRSIKVRANGTTALPVRLATADEINADEQVRNLVKSATEGRWLAVRAVDAASGDYRQALPGDASIGVTVAVGAPSAEGTRTTETAQSFSFRTYGALRVNGHDCGYQRRCTPSDVWRIIFSNPIDAAAFSPSQIHVEPEFPGMTASIYGNQIYLSGYKRGRRTYRVTLDPSIKDQFGQTLGESPALTFDVGAADAALFSQGQNFNVLDPSAQPRFSVYSINHASLKVSLYRVTPDDWGRFGDYMRWAQGYANEDASKQRTPPGKLVSTKTVEVEAQPDELVETRVDLRPALNAAGLGHAVVVVEPTKYEAMPKQQRYRLAVRSWVEATNIGLDAFVDQTDLFGWATSLKDGRPLEGVEMSVHPSGSVASSGADGLARLPLSEERKGGLRVLLARRGDDLAMLPEHYNWWSKESGWYKREEGDALRWYVFDDRQIYRPGEEVHVKGWLRRFGNNKFGDIDALGGAATSVSYVLKDSRGNEVQKGTATVNSLGGFDTSFKLPATLNLGYTPLELTATGGNSSAGNRQHVHQLQVQEFRRPEFEVTTKTGEGTHVIGGHADATVSAAYYAGGGLANAAVNWTVTSTPGQFTPPNRGEYTFGTWTPWWRPGGVASESRTQTFTGHTDAAGKHRLRIDFDSVKPARPSNVSASASVADVNRQTWTDTTTMLVHPADLYVGLRSERMFVQRGQPLVVHSIVTDLDGRAVANRDVHMRAVLLDWSYTNGVWKQLEKNPQECDIKSAGDAVKCTFQPKEGGVYRVTARVLDDRERANESELTLWVAGGRTPPRRDVSLEAVELIPDRKEFRAGETAEVLVQSPFAPAEGVLTLRRSGIVRTVRFHMESSSYTLKIPIEEGYTPNVYAQVDLVGAAPRPDAQGQPDPKLPARPAYAKGTLNLPVPPLSRKLQVTATPREKALEPGAETTVDVEVRDAAGRPLAGSEMAVVVVDESVLSLTRYRIPDPLEVFYSHRAPDTVDYHLRGSVLLGNMDDLNASPFMRLQNMAGRVDSTANFAIGGVSESVSVTTSPGTRRTRMRAKNGVLNEAEPAPPPPSSSPQPSADDEVSQVGEAIRMRENFNALAVFAASVPTDSDGLAHILVKVPDNLTRYRVMAVAVAGGKQFGSGESSITARMPLMVRPSAPRFLNFGDRFELPVVVQNQTDAPMSVDVAVRASNADLSEGGGRRVTVPANNRVEVRFPVAASRAGTARFQMGAASGKWADAAEVQLPVWTPATTEAFATYGEIDAGAIMQPVKAPTGIFPQFGGLEITTSSTQLQELTDAMLYLMAYPYECAEQISSRVMAVAALRDVLTAFEAKGLPAPEEMKRAVARDIKRLQSLQNDDGGFAFWRRGDDSWPYISIHVAHALQRAKEKNFDVPGGMLDKSKNYLRNIERHIPYYYSIECRRALIAYSLYVRNRMGDRDEAKARKLIAEAGLEKLSLEAVGWLLPVLSKSPNSAAQVEAIHKLLNNQVSETAATAHFTSGYSDGEYLLLYSERRADAIILEALIGDRPQSDLIPKIVRGLLAHRTQGRWSNTQENVFTLLALDRYFATYEKATPDFQARAWLGSTFALDRAFRGRTTDREHVQIPMRFLLDKTGGQQNLTLSKEGAGRLYYRVGMQYAPASLKLAAADYGFTVERAYEAVDDEGDVRRDADGTWRVKAGARVRVRLTMVAPTRRYHVALVDPMPAGLEALNPSLAVTGSLPQDKKDENPLSQGGWWWWNRTWFEHQNFRDERAEAFASLLWEGVHNYSYVTRATTPGLFVVPPPKAEEMYHPETFGRGSTDRLRVE